MVIIDMAIKQKTIRYRGLILRLKSDGRYRTDDLKFSVFKLETDVWNAYDTWEAHVIIDDVISGEADTPQKALDIALDRAIKVIDDTIKRYSKQKNKLLKLKLIGVDKV